jgi:hypothetical protein
VGYFPHDGGEKVASTRDFFEHAVRELLRIKSGEAALLAMHPALHEFLAIATAPEVSKARDDQIEHGRFGWVLGKMSGRQK